MKYNSIPIVTEVRTILEDKSIHLLICYEKVPPKHCMKLWITVQIKFHQNCLYSCSCSYFNVYFYSCSSNALLTLPNPLHISTMTAGQNIFCFRLVFLEWWLLFVCYILVTTPDTAILVYDCKQWSSVVTHRWCSSGSLRTTIWKK